MAPKTPKKSAPKPKKADANEALIEKIEKRNKEIKADAKPIVLADPKAGHDPFAGTIFDRNPKVAKAVAAEAKPVSPILKGTALDPEAKPKREKKERKPRQPREKKDRAAVLGSIVDKIGDLIVKLLEGTEKELQLGFKEVTKEAEKKAYEDGFCKGTENGRKLALQQAITELKKGA